MSPRRFIEYSCGHTIREPECMETRPEVIKRSLTRAFSFGLKGQSLAERTRTIQPSRPQRIKSELRRVLSLGMADLPNLRSVEMCPPCRPPEEFTSDEYTGWVDEQSERDEVFGLHLPEGDGILTERERHRAEEDRILDEEDLILIKEIESQQQLAPHEYGSPKGATQHQGSSSGQAPRDSKVLSPKPQKFFH